MWGRNGAKSPSVDDAYVLAPHSDDLAHASASSGGDLAIANASIEVGDDVSDHGSNTGSWTSMEGVDNELDGAEDVMSHQTCAAAASAAALAAAMPPIAAGRHTPAPPHAAATRSGQQVILTPSKTPSPPPLVGLQRASAGKPQRASLDSSGSPLSGERVVRRSPRLPPTTRGASRGSGAVLRALTRRARSVGCACLRILTCLCRSSQRATHSTRVALMRLLTLTLGAWRTLCYSRRGRVLAAGVALALGGLSWLVCHLLRSSPTAGTGSSASAAVLKNSSASEVVPTMPLRANAPGQLHVVRAQAGKQHRSPLVAVLVCLLHCPFIAAYTHRLCHA